MAYIQSFNVEKSPVKKPTAVGCGPPCKNYADLTIIKALEDNIVRFDACDSKLEIDQLQKTLAEGKKPVSSLISAAQAACSELKKARNAYAPAKTKAGQSQPSTGANTASPSKPGTGSKRADLNASACLEQSFVRAAACLGKSLQHSWLKTCGVLVCGFACLRLCFEHAAAVIALLRTCVGLRIRVWAASMSSVTTAR